jgi:hypothetical protein
MAPRARAGQRMALKSGLIEPEQALELLADCDCLQLISPKDETAA